MNCDWFAWRFREQIVAQYAYITKLISKHMCRPFAEAILDSWKQRLIYGTRNLTFRITHMSQLPRHVPAKNWCKNSTECADCVASAARYRRLSDIRGAAKHFERFAPRELRVAGRIGRLLPNINGPDTKVSRLYANLIVSVSLWAALDFSVWTDHLRRPY